MTPQLPSIAAPGYFDAPASTVGANLRCEETSISLMGLALQNIGLAPLEWKVAEIGHAAGEASAVDVCR